MPMNAVYRGAGDLPAAIPVFPLAGALLLPRGQMPLNIFEPRYLEMVDDTMADRHRLIGMIQPDTAHPGPEGEAQSVQGWMRRAHHPDRGDRRWALPDPAHRHHASGSRRSSQSQPPTANAASTTAPLPMISSRARARSMSTATPSWARSMPFSTPTISRPTGKASRTHRTKRWSTRSQ